MRVLAVAAIVSALPALALAAPAHRLDGFSADPVQKDENRLRMPDLTYSSAPHDNGLLIVGLHRSQAPDTPAASGISFGPVHAESETINGRRHVHYRVDGLTLWGGEIGGSVGHHGAMLTLHWGE